MKRINLLTLLVLSAVLGLLLVACGGNGADEPAGPGTATLDFEGTDSLEWVPSSASVPAGSTVEVTVRSTGALEHDWVLVEQGVDVLDPNLTDMAINGAESGLVPGGETRTFTFEAPAAGTYQYVCTVPGHAPAGMVGTLTVN